MAVTLTSPSPCTPWPSPQVNSAPSAKHRQIERRAGDKFLVVEIAAEERAE